MHSYRSVSQSILMSLKGFIWQSLRNTLDSRAIKCYNFFFPNVQVRAGVPPSLYLYWSRGLSFSTPAVLTFTVQIVLTVVSYSQYCNETTKPGRILQYNSNAVNRQTSSLQATTACERIFSLSLPKSLTTCTSTESNDNIWRTEYNHLL